MDDMRFRLSTDKPLHINEFEYQQQFDLHPKSDCLADIIEMQEMDKPTYVFMCYALPGTIGQRVENWGIPIERFPHQLTIEVSAENVTSPLVASYELRVDDRGRLWMQGRSA